ncbi:hypothetical protein OXX69_008623 [Metschnikowia pulcherrima]
MQRSASSCAEGHIRTGFDLELNQVYYYDANSNAISFDSPCEVQTTSKRGLAAGFFARLTSKLSLSRSKSASLSQPELSDASSDTDSYEPSVLSFAVNTRRLPNGSSPQPYHISGATERLPAEYGFFPRDSLDGRAISSDLADWSSVPRDAVASESEFDGDSAFEEDTLAEDGSIASEEMESSSMDEFDSHRHFYDHVFTTYLARREREEVRAQLLAELS